MLFYLIWEALVIAMKKASSSDATPTDVSKVIPSTMEKSSSITDIGNIKSAVKGINKANYFLIIIILFIS